MWEKEEVCCTAERPSCSVCLHIFGQASDDKKNDGIEET